MMLPYPVGPNAWIPQYDQYNQQNGFNFGQSSGISLSIFISDQANQMQPFFPGNMQPYYQQPVDPITGFIQSILGSVQQLIQGLFSGFGQHPQPWIQEFTPQYGQQVAFNQPQVWGQQFNPSANQFGQQPQVWGQQFNPSANQFGQQPQVWGQQFNPFANQFGQQPQVWEQQFNPFANQFGQQPQQDNDMSAMMLLMMAGFSGETQQTSEDEEALVLILLLLAMASEEGGLDGSAGEYDQSAGYF